MSRKQVVYLILVLVLVADQALKIWVKTNMAYGEEIQILGWDRALIHFVENNGMAFGLSFGGAYGKLALTLFRVLAVGLLFAYLVRLLRAKVPYVLLVGYALILAGAVGNILDSLFYGVIFSESSFYGGVAEFLPAGGGYAPFGFGRVVDMFYFPLFYGTYPDWLPGLGGELFIFFRPVFNLADVAISLGVALLLFGYFSRGKRPVAAGAPSSASGPPAEAPR